MNSESLSRLFLQHRFMLMSYLRALVRDPHDAEDLFQEVGLQVLHSEGVPTDPLQFGAWCRGVARNLVLHYWRSKRRRRVEVGERLLDALELAYRQVDPAPDLASRRAAALGECLGQLPPRTRELVRRRYFENQSSAEIGTALRRSAAAVRKMLERVRGELEECIQNKLAVQGLAHD
jgi:RNA polymerase sigma-70 factor (ECF subfamily)